LAREVVGVQVVGDQKIGEVAAQLVMGVVVGALDGLCLDASAPACGLGPWVVGLGQPGLAAVGRAAPVEAPWPGADGVAVAGWRGELDAVVGQDRVQAVEPGFEHVLKEHTGTGTILPGDIVPASSMC
jgi:hypothetical protein